MKVIVVLSFLAVAALGNVISPFDNTAFGYFKKIGIPEAERIRKAEEEYLRNPSRIVNGESAALAQFPWQAGLLISFEDSTGTGVCGASLLNANTLVTAAHCWDDGISQAREYTVVIGSILLFSGGTRIVTSDVIVHPSWTPRFIRNDVAIIKSSQAIEFSATISPISLPEGSELNELFTGEEATVSGFGVTGNSGITTDQFLSHVSANVVGNTACTIYFFGLVQSTNICTSGAGGRGPCGGDSGGPLYVVRNGRPILVGIVSFGSGLGCDFGIPAVYARVTSFSEFIKENL